MQAHLAAPAAEQVNLAAEVFLYGYPLVHNLHECAAYVADSPRLPMRVPCGTSNWLHGQPILNGSYLLPAIRRVE